MKYRKFQVFERAKLLNSNSLGNYNIEVLNFYIEDKM